MQFVGCCGYRSNASIRADEAWPGFPAEAIPFDDAGKGEIHAWRWWNGAGFERAASARTLPDGSFLIATGRLDEYPFPQDARDFGSQIALAWTRWGIDSLEKLHGQFAIAHWDPRSRRLTLARDVMGDWPLYYSVGPDGLAFGTTIDAMVSLPGADRSFDELELADAVTMGSNNQEHTIYRSVHRVLPGGYAIFEDGVCRTGTYWRPEELPPLRLRTDDDYVEAGRAVLDNAVHSMVPAEGPICTMLSGGFDSGGAASTLARLHPDREILAFTRVPGLPAPRLTEVDDHALAGSVAARYPNICWTVASDDPREIDWAAELRQPGAVPDLDPVGVTWFTPLLDAIRNAGGRQVFVGLGGNMSLTYSGYSPLIGQLAARSWGAAAATVLSTIAQQRSLRGSGLLTIARALSFERTRKRHRAGRNGYPWTLTSFISPRFLDEIGYAAHARATGHDLPWEIPDDPAAQRLLFLRKPVLADYRDPVERRHGLVQCDPYRNRRLIEFCLSVPGEQYLRNGTTRWLARRVLADRLPAELLAKNGRGAQCPEWHALITARRPATMAALEEIERSPLACRVLDIERMRHTIDHWLPLEDARREGDHLHGMALHRAVKFGMFLLRSEAAHG